MSSVVFNSMPPEPQRLAWSDWFRRHGVDPGDVAVPGYVMRDEERYQLIYEAFARNAAGNFFLDPVTGDPAREERVFQLEAPPLPYPYPQVNVA